MRPKLERVALKVGQRVEVLLHLAVDTVAAVEQREDSLPDAVTARITSIDGKQVGVCYEDEHWNQSEFPATVDIDHVVPPPPPTPISFSAALHVGDRAQLRIRRGYREVQIVELPSSASPLFKVCSSPRTHFP